MLITTYDTLSTHWYTENDESFEGWGHVSFYLQSQMWFLVGTYCLLLHWKLLMLNLMRWWLWKKNTIAGPCHYVDPYFLMHCRNFYEGALREWYSDCPMIVILFFGIWWFFFFKSKEPYLKIVYSNQLSPQIVLGLLLLSIVYFFLGGGHRERGREKLKQAPHPAHHPIWGSISWFWDCDLSQNQESDAWPTEPPRYPSVIYF